MSFCKDPEVPIRTMFNEVNVSFNVLVARLIFTIASNSFKTMSILSGPIPVEITEILFPLYVPVVVLNSLF